MVGFAVTIQFQTQCSLHIPKLRKLCLPQFPESARIPEDIPTFYVHNHLIPDWWFNEQHYSFNTPTHIFFVLSSSLCAELNNL